MGGSLCIDFKYYPSVVLNRNGRGFFYRDGLQRKFVMTNEMKDLVKGLYQKYKVRGKQNEKI